MTELKIKESERKGLMVALAIIDSHLSFYQSSSKKYYIQSSDNEINYEINFNKKENSFERLKTILEYSYQHSNFVLGQISSDTDILEYTYKLANAYILKINNESVSLKELGDSAPTPIQIEIFNKIIELEKLTYTAYNINKPAYSAMIVARFIAESVQQANLFVHYLDLLDYIKVVNTFSSLVPCHDDECFLKFIVDMQSICNTNN